MLTEYLESMLHEAGEIGMSSMGAQEVFDIRQLAGISDEVDVQVSGQAGVILYGCFNQVYPVYGWASARIFNIPCLRVFAFQPSG